jgi:hypothetical protein
MHTSTISVFSAFQREIKRLNMQIQHKPAGEIFRVEKMGERTPFYNILLAAPSDAHDKTARKAALVRSYSLCRMD